MKIVLAKQAKEVIAAIDELIRFYKVGEKTLKPMSEYKAECPLCETNERMIEFGEDRCAACPWTIITRKHCADWRAQAIPATKWLDWEESKARHKKEIACLRLPTLRNWKRLIVAGKYYNDRK